MKKAIITGLVAGFAVFYGVLMFRSWPAHHSATVAISHDDVMIAARLAGFIGWAVFWAVKNMA